MKNNSFKVYLMVGIPGAGKSTWISHNLGNIPIVSRDIIRHELGFTKGADDKAVLTADGEKMVTQREHELIHQYAKNKQSFVIDDTNTGKFRASMINLLHSVGAYVIGVNLNTPLDICIKRREGQIPAEVMKKIYANKINLKPNEVDEIINVGEEDNLSNTIQQVIKEEIDKIIQRPLYTAIVLDEKSSQTLCELGKQILNEIDNFNPKFFCHHMTIAFGKDLDDKTLDWCVQNENQPFQLIAKEYGISDKAIGVKITTNVPCKNTNPHVTIAINLNTNGKPVDTNFISKWKPLPQPIALNGEIQLIYPTKR